MSATSYGVLYGGKYVGQLQDTVCRSVASYRVLYVSTFVVRVVIRHLSFIN